MRLSALSVGAVLLAAGRASRMEGRHKLLAEFDGVPLVRRSADMLLGSQASPVVVVTGHRREEIEASLAGLDLVIRFNADHASGMASSLACGLAEPKIAGQDGILVMPGDMPGITASDIDRLVDAFREVSGNAIIRAAHGERSGNPVILPKVLYGDLMQLRGDIGARRLIEECGLRIMTVDIGPAALVDVDTPEAVSASGGVLKG